MNNKLCLVLLLLFLFHIAFANETVKDLENRDTIVLKDTFIIKDTIEVQFGKEDTLITKASSNSFDGVKNPQLWIALVGLFIAILSVWISIRTRWDSAKPIIELRREIRYQDQNGKRLEDNMAVLSIFLCNTGLGPAKISSLAFSFNDEEIQNKNTVYGPLEDLSEKIKTEMSNKVDAKSFNILWFQTGNSINAQNHHHLLSFMFNRKEDGTKALNSALSKIRIKTMIYHTSHLIIYVSHILH